MKVTPLDLPEVLLIQPDVYGDARGYFLEAYNAPRYRDAGIDLPFPTQQVLFHDQTEATDGDRRQQREGWPARPHSATPPPRWRARDEAAQSDRRTESRADEPTDVLRAEPAPSR